MAKLIKLNEQDLAAKKFLASLSTDPEGVMVEVEGRRVFIIVRPALQAEQFEEQWTDIKNHRRLELIDKEIDGSITPGEVVELSDLQQQMYRHVDKIAPLPLNEVRRLHEQLLQKAEVHGASHRRKSNHWRTARR